MKCCIINTSHVDRHCRFADQFLPTTIFDTWSKQEEKWFLVWSLINLSNKLNHKMSKRAESVHLPIKGSPRSELVVSQQNTTASNTKRSRISKKAESVSSLSGKNDMTRLQITNQYKINVLNIVSYQMVLDTLTFCICCS